MRACSGAAWERPMGGLGWYNVRACGALRHLYELGQPMLLGSDTPSAPTYGNQPGYDTYREMQLMARAGISLAAIFAAATIKSTAVQAQAAAGPWKAGRLRTCSYRSESTGQLGRVESDATRSFCTGEVINKRNAGGEAVGTVRDAWSTRAWRVCAREPRRVTLQFATRPGAARLFPTSATSAPSRSRRRA